MKTQVKKLAVLLTGLTAVFALSASAAPATTTTRVAMPKYGREAWPNQRVVFILPLQLGPGWNLDREKSSIIISDADMKFQQALQRTGKFSTTQVHKYHPILMRGIQEKTVTKEQVTNLVAAPTLEGLQAALSKMRFDQPPLIAEVSLEEVTTEAGAPIPTVRSQVIGKLYEANDPVAIKTVSVTSDPQPLYTPGKQGGKAVYVKRSNAERLLTAASNAFGQIAQEFVKPIDDIVLPEPTPAADGEATPLPSEIGPDGRPVIRVPQGQVLGTFDVPAADNKSPQSQPQR